MATEQQTEKKGIARFKVPHVYVILFFILIVFAALTYIIPAGEFTRVKDATTGRMVIDPRSYHVVEGSPTKPFDIIRAIPRGIEKAVDIIFMVVLAMAGMQIIIKTGALTAGVTRLMRIMRGKESALLLIAMLTFGVIGGFGGWAEGVLMFIPIMAALTLACGWDALVTIGITTVVATAGFTMGPTNIYTQGVAQGLLKLPLFSGLVFRLVTWVIIMVPTIWYVMAYASKIKKTPSASLVYGDKLAVVANDLDLDAPFTILHKLTLLTLLLAFVFAVYGSIYLGWGMKETGACFTTAGIIGGLLGRRKPSQMAEDYADGAKSIIGAGLTIGIGRGVLVIMENAKIVDSIIYYLANAVQILPTGITAIGMYFVQIIVSLFITSASGMAVTTIPILGPVAELAGSTQQVAVVCYQYGDGFTNMLTPTSSQVWAALALAGGVSITKYWRWIMPLAGIWFLCGAIFVTVANIMRLGPF